MTGEMRDVVRVFESEGPRGGRELVHVLECGCWVINRRRTPAKQLRCIACGVAAKLGRLRPEDVAWQAFQAGMRQSGDFGASLVTEQGVEAANAVFRAWWERR